MKIYHVFIIIILNLSFENIAQISGDAIELTLRQQKSGVWIDSVYAVHIDSLLVIARTASDSLQFIHVFPTINPKSITLYTRASWSNAWRQGLLFTGNSYVDSLSQTYYLSSVQPPAINWYWFDLYFQFSMNTRELANVYNLHPDISGAIANSYGGDGDDIIYFQKNEIQYFVFSQGWGDCPSGCTERHNYYVNIIPDQNDYLVKLVDEALFPNLNLKIYLWNEPPLYEMSMFQNTEQIMDSILNNQNWWVRRHAIEGVWRFFEYEYPWTRNDEVPQFYLLKEDLFLKKDQVISTLLLATNDLDKDVKNSAIYALEKLGITNIEDDIKTPQKFLLYQNYPNPFNPSTKITYTIPNVGNSVGTSLMKFLQFVQLKVYDILGNEIATLVNEYKPAGKYEVNFDASKLSSGVYFYKISAGSFIRTKKMLLIR